MADKDVATGETTESEIEEHVLTLTTRCAGQSVFTVAERGDALGVPSMPQLIQEHPTSDELAAFGLGKLDPAQAEPISLHLAECEPCSETLAGLESDTFLELVRRADHLESRSPDDVVSGNHQPAACNHDATSHDGLPAELTDHPHYRTTELLGRGGMGDVYKAEHLLMNRTVALKAINRKLVARPAAVERFRHEVRAAAQLSHPNIVTAYDADQADDLHFLVMEYVDGTDLAEVVKQQGPLPIDLACDFIRQAADGT